MKLKSVKARQGASWLRSGFLVFFRRPLAFTALMALALGGIAGAIGGACGTPRDLSAAVVRET